MLLPSCYFQFVGWCYCLCIVVGWCYCHGRCYCQSVWKMLNHMYLTFATSVMADVIAWWQMEWPLQGDLADVICHGSIYFNFSSEVLSRTSSHMWGRWYLPMFLLRDGLLTLIYNASLIVLLRFWSSSQLYWNCQYWLGDHWCYCGQRLVRVPSDVLWTSLQRS